MPTGKPGSRVTERFERVAGDALTREFEAMVAATKASRTTEA